MESEASSLMSTSRTSHNEDSEAEDPESDDDLTQESLGDNVLKVQELKSLQDEVNDVLEDGVEEPEKVVEETEEDGGECEEVEWEEELELLEERLENTEPSLSGSVDPAGSTLMNSTVSLNSMSPSITGVYRDTGDATNDFVTPDGSIRKSSISMRSVPPLIIPEENEDTEDCIDESESQLGDIEKDVLHQEENHDLPPNSLPDAEGLDRTKASTPMGTFGDSTLIFIPESDESTEEGTNDGEDFITDGTVLRVLPRSQSDA